MINQALGKQHINCGGYFEDVAGHTPFKEFIRISGEATVATVQCNQCYQITDCILNLAGCQHECGGTFVRIKDWLNWPSGASEDLLTKQQVQQIYDHDSLPFRGHFHKFSVELPKADQFAQRSDACPGVGGAPTRATTLPTDSKERKGFPIASGVIDYFPDALVALSQLSWKGNEQHHPGKPLHWDRAKSADEADTAMRHFVQRGTLDSDGVRHTAKFAWRALALLQKEIEESRK